MFNTCRTLAYSSTPDVDKNIKTPLPTLVLSEDEVPIIPLLAAFANNQNYNPYGPYYSTSTTSYPYTYPSTSSGSCSPSYPGICISPPPPVLNCVDVLPSRNFRVIPPDPHRFDSDRDGIGCKA